MTRVEFEKLIPRLEETRELTCREAGDLLGLTYNQVAYSRRKLGIGRGKQHMRGKPANNQMPIGTRKLCKMHGRDFYLVKVSNTNDWHKDWVLEHKYVWEQVNGKLEKNMQLVHLDGNTLNNSLPNLYAVNKQVAMRLNQNGWCYTNQPTKQMAAIKNAELVTELSDAGFDFKKYHHKLERINKTLLTV